MLVISYIIYFRYFFFFFVIWNNIFRSVLFHPLSVLFILSKSSRPETINDFLSLDLSPLSNLEVRMCHETSGNFLLNIELFGEFVESLRDLPRIRKTAQFLAVPLPLDTDTTSFEMKANLLRCWHKDFRKFP